MLKLPLIGFPTFILSLVALPEFNSKKYIFPSRLPYITSVKSSLPLNSSYIFMLSLNSFGHLTIAGWPVHPAPPPQELDAVLNSHKISSSLSFKSAYPKEGEFLSEFPLNVNIPSISEYLF